MASSWFYSSVITMIHGPTNIKLRPFNMSPKLLEIYLQTACRRSLSPLPFHATRLVNLDPFLFIVTASQFSRHSVTSPRSCTYSSKKKVQTGLLNIRSCVLNLLSCVLARYGQPAYGCSRGDIWLLL